MPLRFSEQIPEDVDKGTFTQRLGHGLKLWMMSVQEAIGGLQGTPDTPSRIEAGVAAAAMDSQAPAPSNHIHDISTAAPSVKVSYNQAPDEGSTTALMRAGARLLLADGENEGDLLRWIGGVWVSVPPQSLGGMGIPGEDGQDGSDGPPGPTGPAGATGPAGPSGTGGGGASPPGFDGEDGIDGIPGPPGPPGTAGAAGAAGATGPAGIGFPGQDGQDGIDGLQGPQGPQGIAGPQGPAGPPGQDGADGADGATGPAGPTGPQGPSGGGGGGSWTEVEIDFGSVPVYEATFTITDAAITSGAVKMAIIPCGKAATGRTADDWQWDGGTFAANPGAGSAACYAAFFPGPVVGKRKLQYQVA